MAQVKSKDFNLTSIQNYLTFSKTNVWAWFRLPESQYEFINERDKEAKANELSQAMNSLVKNEEQSVECQILVNSKVFDSEEWFKNTEKRLQSYPQPPLPYSEFYYSSTRKYLNASGFEEKVVLLGVQLGKRTLYGANGKKEASSIPFLDKLINYVAAAPVDDYVSESEIEYWMNRSSQIVNSLKHSRMNIRTATANEIAFSVMKNFYPSIRIPLKNSINVGDTEKWGEGEVGALVEAEIENNPKFLKITQQTDRGLQTGYRATLCFAKFPEVMNYPHGEPWIHFASYLPFGVDFSIRFSLTPSRQVQKQAERMRKRHVDQADNQANASGEVSLMNREQIQLGHDLNYVLERDKTPWFYGYHRLTVTAETEELLKERVTQVIDHYKDIDILVVWSTGDQMTLLKESIPNDYVRMNSYFQRQELSVIGGGVPSGAGTVGEVGSSVQANKYGRLGPYIGETIGSTRMPVCFSLLTAAEANNPPTTTILGQSGSGKTHLALTLTYQAVLDGAWTIIIDPKGQVGKMKLMPGIENRTKVLDMAYGEPGILSPFLLTDDVSKQKELALETCIIFAGGRKQIDNVGFSALAAAIEHTMRRPNPSLQRVLGILLQDSSQEAKRLGQTLKLASELPLGRLCFPPGEEKVSVDSGLTIFTINGLTLPPPEKKMEDYLNSESLSIAIMYLLTSFTSQLLISGAVQQKQPKLLVIDEAWMVAGSEQGGQLIESFVRMGRSLNCSLLLISQAASEFSDIVAGNTSTTFAFQTEGKKVIQSLYNFLELDTEEYSEDYIRDLRRGECLMKDTTKRLSVMRVDTEWFRPAHEAIL